jgi:quercetin dioxygenase-like cupin family protein
MKQIRWNDVVPERLTELASRQVLHTERMTLVQLVLRRGAVVARHSHENEQISTVSKGVLRFEMGDGTVVVVRAGESLVIPPHVPHAVTAEEDTEVTDVFSPRREDWIRGEDAYLR